MNQRDDLEKVLKKVVSDVVKEEIRPITNRLDGFEQGQKDLEQRQRNLEQKVEAIQSYQYKAHTELVEMIADSNDVNAKELQKWRNERNTLRH